LIGECPAYEVMYAEQWLNINKVGYKPTNIHAVERQIQVILDPERSKVHNEITAKDKEIAQKVSETLKYEFQIAVIGKINFLTTENEDEVDYTFLNLHTMSNRMPGEGRNLPDDYVSIKNQKIKGKKWIEKVFRKEFKEKKLCDLSKEIKRFKKQNINKTSVFSRQDSINIRLMARKSWYSTKRMRITNIKQGLEAFYIKEKLSVFERQIQVLLKNESIDNPLARDKLTWGFNELEKLYHQKINSG